MVALKGNLGARFPITCLSQGNRISKTDLSVHIVRRNKKSVLFCSLFSFLHNIPVIISLKD